MTFKNVSSFFLILICTFSGYYLLSHVYWKQETQVEPDAEQPLFIAQDIETTNFDNNGIRNYILHSKELKHFNAIDETHFTQPLLYTFKKGEKKEWQVSSNSAILRNKHLLILNGDVEISNLLPEAQIKTIKAEQVTLDLSSRDFWTNTKTVINGVNFTTKGNSSKGNFNSQMLELMQEVNTIYEPTKL